MHVIEDEEYACCIDCKREVLRADRDYVLGAGALVCFDCAIRRRGAYHEILGRWTVAPRVDDLLARARTPAPEAPSPRVASAPVRSAVRVANPIDRVNPLDRSSIERKTAR
jgi:hypothetical protein